MAAFEGQVSQVLALAALRRMTELLRSELVLSSQDLDSTTRPLGRIIVELWLNANELLLDPETATDRLVAEHRTSLAQLQHGFGVLWERYEKEREDGIDLRDPNFERAEGQRSNVETLSMRVAQLRQEHGLGSGGLAELNYQLNYRRDSIEDVHVTLDQLFRYIRPEGAIIQLLRHPDEDDTHDFRGPDAIRSDAVLVADILGLFLRISGQVDALDDLKAFLIASSD
jgi:hypothetical protein